MVKELELEGVGGWMAEWVGGQEEVVSGALSSLVGWRRRRSFADGVWSARLRLSVCLGMSLEECLRGGFACQ
ncbi:hypothetical protein EmuJ_000286400 [Echinococcus multilocularis]|uniref:Uncharacterized protein n=1 Tax=Echinococcus multilocularis TaxID=6211 RepID=A0A068XV31_ECHMU|nr:hypothetical protein EmuJ_000286400 [Echinococcus multilocularis]